MSEHVTRLLGAYHDQELNVQQTRHIEAHLEGCAFCRGELERIQTLSQLLSEVPLPERTAAPARFTARVGLLLPRREPTPAQRTGRILQRAIPYALVGLWGFVQAVFTVAFGLQLLLGSNLIPQLSAMLPASQAAFWPVLLNMGAAPGLIEVVNLVLQGITLSDPYLFGGVAYLLVHIVFVVLLAAWLAGWVLTQNKPQLSHVKEG
jgi:predicted anti-sigma-YlaC factor YlaD